MIGKERLGKFIAGNVKKRLAQGVDEAPGSYKDSRWLSQKARWAYALTPTEETAAMAAEANGRVYARTDSEFHGDKQIEYAGAPERRGKFFDEVHARVFDGDVDDRSIEYVDFLANTEEDRAPLATVYAAVARRRRFEDIPDEPLENEMYREALMTRSGELVDSVGELASDEPDAAEIAVHVPIIKADVEAYRTHLEQKRGAKQLEYMKLAAVENSPTVDLLNDLEGRFPRAEAYHPAQGLMCIAIAAARLGNESGDRAYTTQAWETAQQAMERATDEDRPFVEAHHFTIKQLFNDLPKDQEE